MDLPFSLTDFLEVFARYNLAVWPAQPVLAVAAVALVGLALGGGEGASRWVAGTLAALWAWMGVVYHWGYFASINPAALLFGAVFLLQAGLLAWTGVVRGGLRFRPRPDLAGVLGGSLIGYALVLYPLVAGAAGHAFPAQPTFGLPCPTTIFTLGLLLWTPGRPRLGLLAIPLAWSAIGSVAAWRLGMVEDYGLLAAGALTALATLAALARGRIRPAPVPYTGT